MDGYADCQAVSVRKPKIKQLTSHTQSSSRQWWWLTQRAATVLFVKAVVGFLQWGKIDS
jgi:hypothetical protein